MKPTLIVLNNEKNTLTRYVNGKAENQYTITDRAGFDKSFNQRTAEGLRTEPTTALPPVADKEQA